MKLKPKVVVGGELTFANYQEFPRPSFTDKLRFPDNITDLDSGGVSELLGKYTQLYAFANAEVCKANMALLRLDTRESLRRATLLRQQPSLNAQERWRRDTVLDCDADISALNAERLQHRLAKELAETARGNFEKYIAALSRELSRKGYEHKAI